MNGPCRITDQNEDEYAEYAKELISCAIFFFRKHHDENLSCCNVKSACIKIFFGSLKCNFSKHIHLCVLLLTVMRQIVFSSLVTLSLAFQAQAEPHVVMVTPRGETLMEQTFAQELRRRVGPVRFTHVKPDLGNEVEMKALPDRIKNARPDLIYSWGTPTTVALAGTHDEPKITDIPIVFLVVADPLRAKIVKDLKSPNRNVTGTSHLAPIAVQLAAMRDFNPFKTLGVVYNPVELNVKFMLEDLNTEAKKYGFQLLAQPVGLTPAGQPDPQTIPARVKSLKSQGADWLYLGPDTFVAFTHRKLTTTAAIEAKLPSFTANESAIRDGNAMFGMFSPVENLAKFTALKASQILKRERKVGDIPIETLQRFSTVLNMCAMVALNTYPPSSLFRQAEVITPANAMTGPEVEIGQASPAQQPKGCSL